MTSEEDVQSSSEQISAGRNHKMENPWCYIVSEWTCSSEFITAGKLAQNTKLIENAWGRYLGGKESAVSCVLGLDLLRKVWGSWEIFSSLPAQYWLCSICYCCCSPFPSTPLFCITPGSADASSFCSMGSSGLLPCVPQRHTASCVPPRSTAWHPAQPSLHGCHCVCEALIIQAGDFFLWTCPPHVLQKKHHCNSEL